MPVMFTSVACVALAPVVLPPQEPARPKTPQRLRLETYRSAASLRALLLTLEEDAHADVDEVVLVADERLLADLPGLVTRRNPGGRLTVVAPHGLRTEKLAGLGWDSVAVQHDAALAVAALDEAATALVLWPALP